MHQKCDYVFHIGNEIIDIVQNYTYLGTCLSSSGNFTLSLEHVRQKALHALFSLRRNTDFNKLKPSLSCKIFDSMISPILTYNSEVWGAYVKSDFKSTWDSSAIEKLIHNSVNARPPPLQIYQDPFLNSLELKLAPQQSKIKIFG